MAMDLKPYDLAMAQPLVLAKYGIVGQWTCEYQQQYQGGVSMNTVSVDDYFADGRNYSKTQIRLNLPQKVVSYRFESSSEWTLQPGDVLDHQNWKLMAFEADDAEVEQQLKLRESLLKKSQFKTQIIKVDAHQAVVRGLDTGSAINQETTCYR